MADAREVIALVAEQIAMISDGGRREALRALLLPEPRREERDWDYGASGVRYPYWVVAESVERGIILVHCSEGFGPEFPWGFLFTGAPANAERMTLGMDSQWNWYLEEAFVRSGLWRGRISHAEPINLPPSERFVRRPRPGA